jgi:hypothetical protein
MDIEELKDKVVQNRKLITEITKRKDVIEEKIAKYGDLHVPAFEVVQYRDAIKDIEELNKEVLECQLNAMQYLEGKKGQHSPYMTIRESQMDTWAVT